MTKQLIKLVIIASTTLLASSAMAGGRSGYTMPETPVVTSAAADYSLRLLTIKGRNFSKNSNVVLGESSLRVQKNEANVIVAELPSGMKKASYLLTVSSGANSRVSPNPFITTLTTDVD